MTALLMTTLGMVLQGPGVMWIDAYDAGEQGIAVSARASYYVWAWADDSKPATVAIGDARLEGPPPAKPRNEYAWRRMGSAELDSGTHRATLDPSVATLVLITSADYDPAEAMKHLRVLNRPEPVADRRAETFRDSYSYTLFPTFATREAWEKRAEDIRLHARIAGGLIPMPERTPLNARVFDAIRHDDYDVAKVTFESRSGFLVTGSLYTPKGAGPFPAVLCPHGHWKEGRLEDSERASVPARCITFARMGMAAFSYDMAGFEDSRQFPHEFHEPRYELWSLDTFALQLWNSIRAVDFVESLPNVDTTRIGCTGGSGGGTQTMMLCAVDSRIAVAAPVNIISCSNQADCSCESPPILRMNGICDMEIGAAMAPRPLLMVSATGDWTVETPRVEYPAIRSVYELYGVGDKIASVQIDAPHNYNKASREAVYRFFGQWLLGQGERYRAFAEPPYAADPIEAMRIFPGDRPPEGYPSKDALIASMIQAQRARWQAEWPKSPDDAPKFRVEYLPAFRAIFGAEIPEANALRVDRARRKYAIESADGMVSERLVLRRKAVGDGIPMIVYRPDDDTRRDAVLIVNGAGKAALADLAGARPGPYVQALLEQGLCVAAIDVFLLGEHNGTLTPPARRATGTFPDTFEPTDTACRVQDVLASAAYLRNRRDLTGRVRCIGLGDGGMWCLFAAALDDRIESVACDANGFNNNDDAAWVEKYYVPSLRSLGDIVTAAVLIAPRPLAIANAAAPFDAKQIQSAYEAAAGFQCTVQCEAFIPERLTSLVHARGSGRGLR